jgi:surfactin synthase thioesterase subunit
MTTQRQSRVGWLSWSAAGDAPASAAGPRGRFDASLGVIALVHAGGSPNVFRSWLRWLPPNVVVHTLCLPGRGMQLHAPAFDEVGALVEAALATGRRLFSPPYVCFGHSLGALLGFELLHALRDGGLNGPAHFFVSGCRPPQASRPRFAEGRPDDALLSSVLSLMAPGSVTREREQELRRNLPRLRADLLLYDRYRYRQRAPLDCPMTGIVGRDDPLVSRQDIEGWRGLTRRSYLVRSVAGDHFFAEGTNAEFMRLIRRELSSMATMRTGSMIPIQQHG